MQIGVQFNNDAAASQRTLAWIEQVFGEADYKDEEDDLFAAWHTGTTELLMFLAKIVEETDSIAEINFFKKQV